MTKRARKTASEVLAAAQAIQVTGPIDHHTQASSWAPQPAEDANVDDVSIDQVAAELENEAIGIEAEATESEAIEPEAIVTVTDEPAEEDQVVTFTKLLAELDPAAVDEMVVDLAEAIDDRAAYEERVGPDNLSIHKTLKKVRAEFTASKNAARVLLATSTTTSFINRSISEGARYNVYALGKLADLVRGLTDGQLSNAINVACMKSLFSFRQAGVPFTSAMAKAAASDKIRDIDPSVRKHLIRHTVSASTAPTQASSTMQALETLGIVSRAGSRKDSVYTLTDHPAVALLEEKLGFATAA
jgi:hypothetical protein